MLLNVDAAAHDLRGNTDGVQLTHNGMRSIPVSIFSTMSWGATSPGLAAQPASVALRSVKSSKEFLALVDTRPAERHRQEGLEGVGVRPALAQARRIKRFLATRMSMFAERFAHLDHRIGGNAVDVDDSNGVTGVDEGLRVGDGVALGDMTGITPSPPPSPRTMVVLM